MRLQKIDAQLFVQNRHRFARQMKSDSLAIFHSNDLMPRNGDQHFGFRQQSDFFYLSGIVQEESVLILFPGAPKAEQREVLFIKKSDEHSRIWTGEKLSQEEAQSRSGISRILWLDQYPAVLQDLLTQVNRIYLNLNENQPAEDGVTHRDLRLARECMHRFPLHKYHRSQPILRQLRMIKSGTELDLIRKAIEITGIGFEKVLQSIHPGIWEYQLEAIMTGTFLHEGAQGMAYAPIIASGSSATTLHYTTNDKCCQAGDLVLLDFGAEYGNYASDLSRTIPVSGRFSERQAEVYRAVLKILREITQLMVPGMLLEDLNKETGKLLTSALIDLGLLDHQDLQDSNSKSPLYKKYFMHGISHHLGLDVHDLSDRQAPFQAGMVLTCEPGIYISEEDMGIRLENNILITDDGPVDLTSEIPVELEEIETIMQESAMYQY